MVSIGDPSDRNRTHTVGRLLKSREKIVLRVITTPAVSTSSARENWALELPDEPLGVCHCVSVVPSAE
jgi:hypothetical protein